MAKTIRINYDGIDYTLEYTRKTVSEMENAGFILAETREKPVTNIPLLFEGAFLAHHRHITKTMGLAEKIYNSLTNRDELIKKLMDMYRDSVETLFDEPEPSEKNASWEANF